MGVAILQDPEVKRVDVQAEIQDKILSPRPLQFLHLIGILDLKMLRCHFGVIEDEVVAELVGELQKLHVLASALLQGLSEIRDERFSLLKAEVVEGHEQDTCVDQFPLDLDEAKYGEL